MNFEKYINNPSCGYVIKIFNNGKFSEYVIGNKCVLPNIEKTTSDTLYDIASLTKVFTSTLVYIAYEEGKIDINSYVYDIDNNFKNLKDIKVIDLLSHNQEIWTDGYLGNAKSKEEFYKILYSASVKSDVPTYIDAHYIILSTLLEKIYQMSYKEICETKIFRKLDLKNTTFNPDCHKCASNNYEHLDNKVIDYIYPGVIHDTKARVAKNLGITTGHASIFTTADDLLKFLNAFLDFSLLKKETINLMLEHRDVNLYNYERLVKLTDKSEINEMYEQALKIDPSIYISRTYNNMGTRYRNDIISINDIPKYASNNSISFSGYTGPMFTIDFERKIIVVIMCNVMHKTKLNREERKTKVIEIMDYIFEQL